MATAETYHCLKYEWNNTYRQANSSTSNAYQRTALTGKAQLQFPNDHPIQRDAEDGRHDDDCSQNLKIRITIK